MICGAPTDTARPIALSVTRYAILPFGHKSAAKLVIIRELRKKNL